jgi:competence protein ComEA
VPQPVDLNAATASQLEALPGIGPALAGAIVEHRTRHGRFRAVTDLLDVPGIGPAKLDAIRALVRAGQ